MKLAELIYWLAINAYSAAIRIAALFSSKAKLFVVGRQGLFATIERAMANEQRMRIWIHCASLGEFEQGRPVLEALRRAYSAYAIVVTFFSPSGYEIRKNYTGADYVFYLPEDGSRNATKFLRLVNPACCIFVKYEFWYYFLAAIKRSNIPLFLVSGIFRRSQSFFSWYGGFHRSMLRCFSCFFVQDAHSQALLQTLGITEICVSGDTRFDRVLEAAALEKDLPIASAFCTAGKIIIAGSTWPADEALLQKAFAGLGEHWKLMIVPHEASSHRIHNIEKLFAGEAICWSQWNDSTDCRVLVVDKVGYLAQLYRYATVAWIGGGFGRAGVHNVLEAAVYGVPCMYGPVYHHFPEAMQLIEAGGAVTARHAAGVLKQLSIWEHADSYSAAHIAARNYVGAHAGATRRILDYIDSKNLLKVS